MLLKSERESGAAGTVPADGPSDNGWASARDCTGSAPSRTAGRAAVTETAERLLRPATSGLPAAGTNRSLAAPEAQRLVLIVEDDPAGARVLEAKLMAGGHRGVSEGQSNDG